MFGSDTALDALLELAELVLRDSVESDQLATYLERRLSVDLIEMHAVCRYEAARIADCGEHLPPEEVANRLRQTARLQTSCAARLSPTQCDPGSSCAIQEVIVRTTQVKRSIRLFVEAAVVISAMGVSEFLSWYWATGSSTGSGSSWKGMTVKGMIILGVGFLYLSIRVGGWLRHRYLRVRVRFASRGHAPRGDRRYT